MVAATPDAPGTPMLSSVVRRESPDAARTLACCANAVDLKSDERRIRAEYPFAPLDKGVAVASVAVTATVFSSSTAIRSSFTFA